MTLPGPERRHAMLLTTRTPHRISLFGGGSDYPDWFMRERGAVLGMAINKYVYVSALRLQDFLEYRYRVSYSRVETAHEVSAIAHPVVRAVLDHWQVRDPLDISVMSDLPARTGLGSSSSFSVGFRHLVAHLQGTPITRSELARDAIHVERVLLAERGGVQDQYHAAFGGFNRFDFNGTRVTVSPVQLSGAALRNFTDSCLLVYTGITRSASDVVASQVEATRAGTVDGPLRALVDLVDAASAVIETTPTHELPSALAALLHEGWEAKKRLSSQISSTGIDALYDLARRHGAIGGKLCGAGAGGFLLLVADPADHPRIVEAIAPLQAITFRCDPDGAVVLDR